MVAGPGRRALCGGGDRTRTASEVARFRSLASPGAPRWTDGLTLDKRHCWQTPDSLPLASAASSWPCICPPMRIVLVLCPSEAAPTRARLKEPISSRWSDHGVEYTKKSATVALGKIERREARERS